MAVRLRHLSSRQQNAQHECHDLGTSARNVRSVVPDMFCVRSSISPLPETECATDYKTVPRHILQAKLQISQTSFFVLGYSVHS